MEKRNSEKTMLPKGDGNLIEMSPERYRHRPNALSTRLAIVSAVGLSMILLALLLFKSNLVQRLSVLLGG